MRFYISIVQLKRVILALSLLVAIGGSFPVDAQVQQPEPVQLEKFDLLTASTGWVLLDQRLFWTSDAGVSWKEIGPVISAGGAIQDITFIDSNTGWVLWTSGPTGFELAHTVDQGLTWTTRPLSLIDADRMVSPLEKAQMGWLDSQNGWISLKQESGSNFSIGSLFTTTDDGETWNLSTLPVADQLYFSDAQTGWAVGGPSGHQVFRTADAGATWKNNEPAELVQGTQVTAYRPFSSGGKGLLVMTTLGEDGSYLKAFSMDGSSGAWSLLAQTALEIEPGILGLSILDPQNLIAVIPGTTSILRLVDGKFDTLKNQDGFSAGIVQLDMVSMDNGWAKWIDSTCSMKSPPGQPPDPCRSTIRLLRTQDGGSTWTSLLLPGIRSDSISVTYPAAGNFAPAAGEALSQQTSEVLTGQGFDRCEIPTLSQMQTWSGASPYDAVNLYIGGSSRACDNTPLTASYLFQLNQQGWKFIPTWVGPQAPCTGFNSRISSDVATAYNQGVNQANLAVDRLVFLGLTKPDQTGSVIYYDIEAYGTQQACREAVNSFMNGWVSQIHARGNLAGVYGSTLCNTGLSDFLGIPNVPDVIWAARWYHNLGAGYYDPTASVWDLGNCIPSTAWANHQRIRQYEGDHLENWGSLTLDIDSNALDGVVAIPYDYPNVANVVRTDINPTNVATVSFTVSFSKPVTGVDNADFNLMTTGVTNASIASISGSGDTYTVSVNTGTGDGSIRLDVEDNDSIRDASNNSLGGSGNGNGNYTYGPSYTIRKSSLFADVPGDHWAKSYVERLYQAGVTSGCNAEPLLYCPDLPVTRDQMAVFLLRAKHGASYIPPAAAGIFQDVPSDYWAAAWIEQLAAEGITSGCSTDPLMYCPAAPITRDQMAVFLLKGEHGTSYLPPAPAGVFEDVPSDYWSAAWIEQLAAEGITSGCSLSPALYCPTTPVSRDQMSIFLVDSFHLP